MKELSGIIRKAEEALRTIEGGKEYPSFYVLSRFEKASNGNPGDQLISNMRDVIRSHSKNNEFISKGTIASIYDDMYGLSGGTTSFRDVLGDLLPDNHGAVKTPRASYSRNRDDLRPIDLGNDKPLSDLSEAFSSLFSLGSNPTPGFYDNNTFKKAERITTAQLKSIGFEPQGVKAVKNNDHYILCVASYDTSNFKQVNVKIPVKISGGALSMPSHIISDGNLIDLDKDNLFLYIKDSANHSDKIGVSKFSSQRVVSEYRNEATVLPASLEKYADLENEIVVASSNFSRDEIIMANNVVASELASVGISNSQVKVSSSGHREIVFDATIPTKLGNALISIPVEIHNGKPILPSKFSSKGPRSADDVYDLSERGIRKFLSDVLSKEKLGSFARDGGEMARMSYHELMDLVMRGAATKDYKISEDALSVIQTNYNSDHYKAALDKFSMMLKSSFKDEEREALVSAAISRGDLIITSTSIEPYCPKLGLTLRNVDFDSKGRPVPRGRADRNANLRGSGAGMSTSKIVLT